MRCWLACAGVALAGVTLRADGIAVSNSGLTWANGVGGYGEGWGVGGTSVHVQRGDTVYLKFYSDSGAGVTLHYAEHGRKWPDWRPVGPATASGIGDSAATPIVLKISNIGTPHCVVSWINGADTSGVWIAFNAPGPYDLGTSRETMWTLPPLIVADVPRQSFWSRVLGDPKPGSSPSGNISVPDGGSTAVLLLLALLSLAAMRRTRS